MAAAARSLASFWFRQSRSEGRSVAAFARRCCEPSASRRRSTRAAAAATQQRGCGKRGFAARTRRSAPPGTITWLSQGPVAIRSRTRPRSRAAARRKSSMDGSAPCSATRATVTRPVILHRSEMIRRAARVGSRASDHMATSALARSSSTLNPTREHGRWSGSWRLRRPHAGAVESDSRTPNATHRAHQSASPAAVIDAPAMAPRLFAERNVKDAGARVKSAARVEIKRGEVRFDGSSAHSSPVRMTVNCRSSRESSAAGA